jgi:hypothetical protein
MYNRYDAYMAFGRCGHGLRLQHMHLSNSRSNGWKRPQVELYWANIYNSNDLVSIDTQMSNVA